MPNRTAAIIGALALALTLTAAGCGGTGASTDRTLVAHDFSTSSEEWLIAGDTGVVAPAFHPDGGRPGGYISNEDEGVGETWYFRAPARVLEQLALAERGTLSYRLRQSSTDAGFVDDDVVITGPAGRLSYRFGTAPGTDWTEFSVELSAASGWRWNWSEPATAEQMGSVLARPTSLEIRGEYRTGDDVGGLDSFALIVRD
jgi:alkaline phosphatase D